MVEYWTVEQARDNAELLAKEFGNRQILIIGIGLPTVNAPLGVEYEDRSVLPANRYRKVGHLITDWTLLRVIEPASSEETLQGVNDSKMVTPAKLQERLSQLTTDLMGLPTNDVNELTNTIEIVPALITNSTLYELTINKKLNATSVSLNIKDYPTNIEVGKITGGEVGQIVVIRRKSNQAVTLKSSEDLKLSSDCNLNDVELHDSISLQKVETNLWVEIARKIFN